MTSGEEGNGECLWIIHKLQIQRKRGIVQINMVLYEGPTLSLGNHDLNGQIFSLIRKVFFNNKKKSK